MTEKIEEMIADAVKEVKAFTASADSKFATKEDVGNMRTDLKSIEAKMSQRPIGDDKNLELRKHIDAMVKYARTGTMEATLSVNKGPSAGYLAPPEYVKEILRLVYDMGGIRAFARKFTTSASMIEIPIEMSGTTAFWVGELEPVGDGKTPKYGMRRIPIHTIGTVVPLTVEMRDDAAFDIEAEIRNVISLAFAQQENWGFLYGKGANIPEGLLQSNLVPTKNVINVDPTAPDFADDLIMATAELPVINQGAYRWFMTNKTFTYIRTLKTPAGAYAFDIPITADGTRMLNGYPISFVPELPNYDDTATTAPAKIIGGKTYSILFGDMGRTYGIVDRMDMEYLFDETSRKRERVMELMYSKRLGGGVLNGTQMLKINTKV